MILLPMITAAGKTVKATPNAPHGTCDAASTASAAGAAKLPRSAPSVDLTVGAASLKSLKKSVAALATAGGASGTAITGGGGPTSATTGGGATSATTGGG